MTGRKATPNPMCNRCYEEARQRCPHDIEGRQTTRSTEPHCEDDLYGPCGCPDE